MSEDRWTASNLLGLFYDLLAYGLGSAAALALDVSILSLLTRVGMQYLISAAFGFTAGLCCIYLISVKVVFRTRRRTAPSAEFLWFVITGALGLALNELVIFTFVTAVQFTIVEAKFFAACIVFLFNFFMRRRFLFSETRQLEQSEPMRRFQPLFPQL
jgi:putative flippase GtrA